MSEYVIVTNHGNAFGTGDWLTFNCPNCGNGVYQDAVLCEKCNQALVHKPKDQAALEAEQ